MLDPLSKTERYLLDKYGHWLLTSAELAEELRKEPKTVLNDISAERFPIRTRKEGKYRVADLRDVAAYLDKRWNESS